MMRNRRVFLAGLTGVFIAPAVSHASGVPMPRPNPDVLRLEQGEHEGERWFKVLDANGNVVERGIHTPEPSAADLAPKYLDRGVA